MLDAKQVIEYLLETIGANLNKHENVAYEATRNIGKALMRWDANDEKRSAERVRIEVSDAINNLADANEEDSQAYKILSTMSIVLGEIRS
jgi:hypothetical protein